MARIPDAASNQLTEAEFAQWEPVADVVAFVREKQPFLYGDTIKARVRSGALRMAVRRMVELDERGDPIRESRRRIIMPAWIGQPDERFWDIGDHTVKVARDSTGYSGWRVSAEIEGCRFDPEGADQLRRDLGLPPKHVLPAPPPPVQISRAPPPIEPIGIATVSYGGVRRLDHFPELRQPQPRQSVDMSRVKAMVDALTQVGSKPLPEPEVPEADARPRKVSQKELVIWYQTKFPENPGLPMSTVKRMAEEHFDPRPVTRRFMEAVIRKAGHTLSIGNPAFRRK